MAGGRGTRLQPLTFIRPKPMIPLVNKPIMLHMIERLKSYGYNDMIITLSYMAENIRRYFKDGSDIDVNIKYTFEKWPLGTGGSVKKSEKFIEDSFFVLSGDIISNIDFRQVFDFHKKKKAIATIVLTRVPDPTHFGIAVINDENQIIEFLEKPSMGDVFSNLVNTGIYVFEPEIFEYLNIKKGKLDFSKHVFPLLIKENAGLYGFIFEGYWNDVGRPETYLKATYDLLNFNLASNIPGEKIKKGIGRLGDIWVGKNVNIDPKARLEGPIVIGDDAKIEENCRIGQGSVIGNNVSLKKNSVIEGSIIFSNNVVGENSHLTGSIIDSRVNIGFNTTIERNAVIGSFVEIGNDCIIKSSRYITNNIRISDNSYIDSDYMMEVD
jgi:mannose-1-phosphate guanylyltransferase